MAAGPSGLHLAPLAPRASWLCMRCYHFRVVPNDLRVVTNVVHNVHTIHDPKNHDRAPIPLIQLCGAKAPLTLIELRYLSGRNGVRSNAIIKDK
jgi:hypothetical protein